LQKGNDVQGQSSLLQLLLLDWPYMSITSCYWPVVISPFQRYYHFSSVCDLEESFIFDNKVYITSCVCFPTYV